MTVFDERNPRAVITVCSHAGDAGDLPQEEEEEEGVIGRIASIKIEDTPSVVAAVVAAAAARGAAPASAPAAPGAAPSAAPVPRRRPLLSPTIPLCPTGSLSFWSCK